MQAMTEPASFCTLPMDGAALAARCIALFPPYTVQTVRLCCGF